MVTSRHFTQGRKGHQPQSTYPILVQDFQNVASLTSKLTIVHNSHAANFYILLEHLKTQGYDVRLERDNKDN